MSYLSKFASLVRLNLNASQQNKIQLQDEIQLLKNYLELEKLRFKNKFDFQVLVDSGMDVLNISIPPLLIQPFVENAIIHGISNKKSDGYISVILEKVENRLKVVVSDNGEEEFNNSSSVHVSRGISLTNKRLQIINKSLNMNQVNIITKKDSSNKKIGLDITLEIVLDSTSIR